MPILTADAQHRTRADRDRLDVSHLPSNRSFSFSASDEVTALLALAYRTASGEPAQCIVAGCSGGSLHIFDYEATPLLSHTSNTSVLDPAGAIHSIRHSEGDLLVVHARAVVILDGESLLSALQASQSATATGGEAQAAVAHRVWSLPNGVGTRLDACVLPRGVSSPLDADDEGGDSDQLRLLLAGDSPSLVVCDAPDEPPPSALGDAALLVGNAVSSTLSFASRWWSAPAQDDTPPTTTAPLTRGLVLSTVRAIRDPARRVHLLRLHPAGELVAAADSLGRVMLLDVPSLVLCRVLRTGPNPAECCWLQPRGGGAALLAVHVPHAGGEGAAASGVIEVWGSGSSGSSGSGGSGGGSGSHRAAATPPFASRVAALRVASGGALLTGGGGGALLSRPASDALSRWYHLPADGKSRGKEERGGSSLGGILELCATAAAAGEGPSVELRDVRDPGDDASAASESAAAPSGAAADAPSARDGEEPSAEAGAEGWGHVMQLLEAGRDVEAEQELLRLRRALGYHPRLLEPLAPPLLQLARRRLATLVRDLEQQCLNASPQDAASLERLVINLPPMDVSCLATAGTATTLPPGGPYELAASIASLLAQAEQLSADAVDSSCQRVAEAVFNHFARETGRSTYLRRADHDR